MWILFLLIYITPASTTLNPHFAPEAADDYKRSPIFELTQDNYEVVIHSSNQPCTLIFVERYPHSAPKSIRLIAHQIARLLRDHQDTILLAHTLSTVFVSDKIPPIFTKESVGNGIPKIWPPVNEDVSLLLLSNEHQPQVYTKDSDDVYDILQWTIQECGGTALLDIDRSTNVLEKAKQIDETNQKSSLERKKIQMTEEAIDDERDLSIIFKTDQTQALLNADFQADPQVKTWVREYCSNVLVEDMLEKEKEKVKEKVKEKDIPSGSAEITRMNVKDATFHRVYCQHVFAGKPFIITGAADDWESVQHWGKNNTWSKILDPRTIVRVDNGLESSWGSRMTVHKFEKYIQDRRDRQDRRDTFQNANKQRNSTFDAQNALAHPPWSSVYAYLHQHSKIHNGKFASDVMWNSFHAPKVLNDNNWFQLMGACFKMMTVTFWAAHGARQSNHQDDFGSSKWQVQVYGRKKWIMHPPEQSLYLYNGLVDPFRPNYSKYPLYKKATPLEFTLEKGDILFWSAGWWHATLAIEDSLAIAQNILNEHNYDEFKRASQLACKPKGSHGIWSPWCACFRRCYSTWDDMYTKWVENIQTGQQDTTTFSPANTNKMKSCCNDLNENGLQGTVEKRIRSKKNSFFSQQNFH